MGAITFFRLEDLNVEHAGDIKVHSKIEPQVGFNYLHLVIQVLKLGQSGGSPRFNYKVQISNDMQNWVDVAAFTGNTSSETTVEVEGAVRGGYLRVEILFELMASNPGDVAFTTFTIVGNLIRSAA